jgi:MATE family multidrug resistance protein
MYFSLTTLRELLRLSLPMVVSQGAFAVMIFTDRWFMAQIDATHIAAALGGGVASFFCFSLFMGIITYANALVAQYYGAGEHSKCPRVVTQGIFMAICCIPLLALGAYFVGDLFEKMGHDPAQVELERVYFFILMGGSFFTLVKACIACYFSGIGRTKVVMISDLLGVLLNIPLTWMLVFGKFGLPQMGIAGAAVSTVIASLFSIGLFLYFYFGKEHRAHFKVLESFHLDRHILRRYLRLGTPSGLESFMNTATFNLFLLMFQSYGIVQGASMAIVFNWDMLSFIPMIGLNIGVMSLIGRFVGANDMQRANQVISSGFIVAMTYSGLLALIFLFYRVPLVEVFATPGADFTEIRDLASQMMVGLTTYMVADAIILIAGGALRGAGDTRWLMMASITLHMLMLVAQYFIIMVYDYGPMVSWWTFVVTLISLALIYLWRLLGGVWRQPERLARVMME